MQSSREHLAAIVYVKFWSQTGCIMEDTKLENIKGIIWLHTASGGELVIALFLGLRRC